jgi:hypothetical protein
LLETHSPGLDVDGVNALVAILGILEDCYIDQLPTDGGRPQGNVIAFKLAA